MSFRHRFVDKAARADLRTHNAAATVTAVSGAVGKKLCATPSASGAARFVQPAVAARALAWALVCALSHFSACPMNPK